MRMIWMGIPIGFYGYIFPGNINLMVVELYQSNRFRYLFFILCLIVVFETLYCVGSLLLLNHLRQHPGVYAGIVLASHLLLLAMGTWMLFEPTKDPKTTNMTTVYRGVFSILLHPQQIPFWTLVGVLFNNYLHVDTQQHLVYLFALFNALGVLLAMLFHIALGAAILRHRKLSLGQITKGLGAVYIVLSLYEFIKLAARYLSA